MAVSFFKEVEINMDSAQFPIKILECPVCYNLPENSIFVQLKIVTKHFRSHFLVRSNSANLLPCWKNRL